jgi:hypothetical protein
MDRAPRRWGSGGGIPRIDGDARVDARDEAIMALERASSLMAMESSITLVLAGDWLDIDASLGVEEGFAIPWFLVDPRGGGTRGGSLGFSSSDSTDEFRDPTEGRGLDPRLS